MIEKMRERGFFPEVVDCGSEEEVRLIVRFRDATWKPRQYAPIRGEVGYMEHGGSLPLGFSLAALKALGVEVEG